MMQGMPGRVLKIEKVSLSLYEVNGASDRSSITTAIWSAASMLKGNFRTQLDVMYCIRMS